MEKPKMQQKVESIGERDVSLDGSMDLSKEMYDLVGVAHKFSPEDLRTKLTEMADKVADLERKSRTDELTGLMNRRGFNEEAKRLEAIFAREREGGHDEIAAALLMIDLDGFKEVNDTCGHAGGDKCLQIIAERVKEVLRESDVFARMGGDEFSIFLPEDNEAGAVEAAQKVRRAIEDVTKDMHREYPNYKGSLSASIGIVPTTGNGEVAGKRTSIKDLLSLADYAAYVTKAAGKRGELTLRGAREIDADGRYERDFLAGKDLPR